MIFMGMGCDHSTQIVQKVFSSGSRWHLNALLALRCSFKSDTAVDHQPLAVMAEEIQVHSNLTAAAKG